MSLSDEQKAQLLDPGAIDELLATLPPDQARNIHACTHTTFSPNVFTSQTKTNVIPDRVVIDVDVRTVGGEGPDDVHAHLEAALGELAGDVEVESLMDDRASTSPPRTPLWDSLQKAARRSFPDATLQPAITVGFTDARIHRELGAVAYGAGLLSPAISAAEFATRFHGNDERIDLESVRLTTCFYRDVITDLLG